MNENCENLSCVVPANAVQDYLNQYSLEALIIGNAGYTTIINGIPYTIPPNTFIYSIPAGPIFSPLTYHGCLSNISIPIPPGSSFAAIQALVQQMLNQAAAQQAQCNAVAAGGAPPQFVNQQVITSCTTAPNLNVLSGTLPSGITLENFLLVAASGIFSSNISQADANAAAAAFLDQLLATGLDNGSIVCGWTNTEQSYTCPTGDVETIAAGTYFSTVSLADANATALAAAQAACPFDCGSSVVNINDLVWVTTFSEGTLNSSSAVGATIANNITSTEISFFGQWLHGAHIVYDTSFCIPDLAGWSLRFDCSAITTAPAAVYNNSIGYIHVTVDGVTQSVQIGGGIGNPPISPATGSKTFVLAAGNHTISIDFTDGTNTTTSGKKFTLVGSIAIVKL